MSAEHCVVSRIEENRLRNAPVVYVAARGPRVGPLLSQAMAAQPVRVILLADAEARAHAESAPGVEVIDSSFASRHDVRAAFDAAIRLVGPPDQVLVSILPGASINTKAICETNDVEWQAACASIIRSTLYCLQAVGSCMERGSIAVIGPAFTLCGSAGLIALSTASEAQRGLVKSAARQWGPRGLRINWVGVTATELAPALADAPLPFRPERVPVALAHRPSIAAIAPLLALLGGDAGRELTGASINLDGGEWMLP